MAWQKGQSGNPGGRPKGSKNYFKRLESGSLKALNFLIDVIDDEEAQDTARIKAATYIIDRQWGRPKQQMELTHEIGETYADTLASLAGITQDQIEAPLDGQGEVVDLNNYKVQVDEGTTPNEDRASPVKISKTISENFSSEKNTSDSANSEKTASDTEEKNFSEKAYLEVDPVEEFIEQNEINLVFGDQRRHPQKRKKIREDWKKANGK